MCLPLTLVVCCHVPDCAAVVLCCAVSQGSSEYNITVLLHQKDSERALRAVHSRFYLSDVPIGVGIVGPGLIGATLLDQLKEQVGVKDEMLHHDQAATLQTAGRKEGVQWVWGDK